MEMEWELAEERIATLKSDGHSCDDCGCNIGGLCLPNSLILEGPYKAENGPCSDWGGIGGEKMQIFIDPKTQLTKDLLHKYQSNER
jgi:hypothetical protein